MNNKSSIEILGWGVIIALIIRALPLILVWGFCFWFLGGFGVLAKVLGFILGLFAFLWITGGPIYLKLRGENPTEQHKKWLWTAYLIVYAIVFGLALSCIWWVLGLAVVVVCFLGLLTVWM